MSTWLSFELSDAFVDSYASRKVEWGFPSAGGLSLGEIVFVSKYSRLKEDGTKERWHDVCRRVVEGTMSILKDHCIERRTPWDEQRGVRTAQEMFDRMWNFKWMPPGRGLWMMGTEFVHEQRNSAALQNCAYVSTKTRPIAEAIERLMDMSMLGVGVGFDDEASRQNVRLYQPSTDGTGHDETGDHVIPFDDMPADFDVWYHVDPDAGELVIEDSREGWSQSTRILIEAFTIHGRELPLFNYTGIRGKNENLAGFGGQSAGPEPLIEFHTQLVAILAGRDGDYLTSIDVGDLANLAGRCVVAGSSRRSALIWLGRADDKEFLLAKNAVEFPKRNAPDTGWSFASNNSIVATVGEKYDHIIDGIKLNGEPGLVYLDLCRSHGRLIDPATNADYRVSGLNPCGEMPLEDGEMCTLVNTYPTRASDESDYMRTLKFAFMYGKAVTLFATHWEDTNEVMRRNHRIGTAMSGQAQFVEEHGYAKLKRWMDDGYAELKTWDRIYSEWLGVRESIKLSTVKPDGTTPLMVGTTSGSGWPVDGRQIIRRMRFGVDEPIVQALRDANVRIEPDVTDTRRVVASLPVAGLGIRDEKDVSVWEKASLASLAQTYWSDNAVSTTLSFREDEADQIGAVLAAFDGKLKTASFLPLSDVGAYPQMPQESIDYETYSMLVAEINDVDIDTLYASERDAEGSKFCDGDACEITL